MAAAPPMHYATSVDGVRIAYLSVGSGAPLVFASNIFGDAPRDAEESQHLRVVTDRLAALGWWVVLFDHRGIGASDRNVTDFSLDARVETSPLSWRRSGSSDSPSGRWTSGRRRRSRTRWLIRRLCHISCC